jgi:hypothetical protein
MGAFSKEQRISISTNRGLDKSDQTSHSEVGKMVQICVHMYINRKMKPVETIPGMG